jgi:hypothetical protein
MFLVLAALIHQESGDVKDVIYVIASGPEEAMKKVQAKWSTQNLEGCSIILSALMPVPPAALGKNVIVPSVITANA